MEALRRFALAAMLAIGAELCAAATAARAAGSAAPRVSEYDVKATFLFNFIKFTSWPESVLPLGSPLEACVFGNSHLSTTLEGFGGRLVDGHRLEVTRVVDPSDLQFCHLVFVSESESTRATAALGVTKNLPTLTVGEQPDFLIRGGMINFVVTENRVRFDINQTVAERANLKISAHLLRLARQTGDGRQP